MNETIAPKEDEENLEFPDFITQRYYNLVDQESKPADPDELINIGVIDQSCVEYQMLIDSGAQINSDTVTTLTRQQLLDAGFAFINKIGNGEKSIINDIVPIDSVQTSFSNRILLTNNELEQIAQYQEKKIFIPNEISRDDLPSLRMMMLSTLEMAQNAMSLSPTKETELFQAAQEYIMQKGTEEDKHALTKYIAKLLQDDSFESRIKFDCAIKHCLAGIPTSLIGNVPISMFFTRKTAVNDRPSPFIDSGFHFGKNEDVTFYPDDPKRTLRLNSVVIHLLSRGICEMGGSSNGSHDQRYATPVDIIELLQEMFAPANASDVADSNAQLISHRLLSTARASE